MKKQLLIIGIIVLLVAVGLSGCEQKSNTGNSNSPSDSGNSNIPQSSYVQISNVKVTTIWSDGYYNGRHGQIDGFSYQDIPAGMSGYYEISGNVKNIASKPIDSATLTVKFYDNNGNYLDSSTTYVSTLYMEESQSFKADIGPYSSYFTHISDYKIEITNVQLHQ